MFDRQDPPAYLPVAGYRLLIAFAFLEFVLEPRTIAWLQLPQPPLGLLMFVRLGLGIWLVPRFARIDTSMLGFRRWREWTKTERSYLVQVLAIAGIVLTLVLAPQWGQTLARHGWTSVVLAGLLPYFAFGFYQEVAYRGILQTELIRRWGGPLGVLASNTIYAFGPIHADYYALPPSTAIPLFLSVFSMGMLFALIFRRSRNLWIVALMHGTGNALIAVGMGNLAF